jgi:glutathione synthase
MVDGEDDPNLTQMIEAVLKDGYATVQEFVPGGEEGDMRLFLLEGEPMEHDGKYAAFRRVPNGTDPRANISAGGKPEETTLGDREFEIVATMRDKLLEDGMFFVGLDVIGNKVVEINAESPGGLQSAEHFTQHDFGLDICEALERRVDGS